MTEQADNKWWRTAPCRGGVIRGQCTMTWQWWRRGHGHVVNWHWCSRPLLQAIAPSMQHQFAMVCPASLRAHNLIHLSPSLPRLPCHVCCCCSGSYVHDGETDRPVGYCAQRNAGGGGGNHRDGCRSFPPWPPAMDVLPAHTDIKQT